MFISCRRCGGKLFHTRGPATLKLRSPKLLCVRGMKHVLAAAERSWQRSLSVTSWVSSAIYAGVWQAGDWCTRHATLYSTRWRTCSQCSWRSTGVIWSHRRAPVTRRAAAFWMDSTFRKRPSDMHGVAVVKTTADKRLNCCFGGGGCHWSNSWT